MGPVAALVGLLALVYDVLGNVLGFESVDFLVLLGFGPLPIEIFNFNHF